jgi:hypothetical protein
MATTLTLNYGWIKPNPFEEIDIWGGELNANFDDIDATVFAVSGVANAALPKAGGTMTGPLNLQVGSPTGQQAVSFAFLDATYASLLDISGLAPLASPVFTGNPTAPTPAPGDNDFSIATTAFVVAGFAALDSPAFTGTPTAPTPSTGDNDTSIATSAFVQDAVTRVIENNQVTSAYTLLLTDAGKMITMANAAPFTLTIPQFTSVAFPNNVRIDLLQAGAGQVTVVPDTNVTILSSGSKVKLKGQYSGATLWKVSTNIWILIGDIAA